MVDNYHKQIATFSVGGMRSRRVPRRQTVVYPAWHRGRLRAMARPSGVRLGGVVADGGGHQSSRRSMMATQPSSAAHDSSRVEIDVSDVDHRVGKPIGGGQLWDPCSSSDIRRWVMAMDYPNPLHWDERFARDSKFGGLVAPQSIAVGAGLRARRAPACVGHIPNSHLIFGGEEWWFYGCPVRPGDQLFQERRFHDYKVAETKFAGPDHVFARRHHPPQPARRPGRQGALHRDPLPRRGGRQARHVREPARRNQALDPAELEEIEQAAPRLARVQSDWASPRTSTK